MDNKLAIPADDIQSRKKSTRSTFPLLTSMAIVAMLSAWAIFLWPRTETIRTANAPAEIETAHKQVQTVIPKRYEVQPQKHQPENGIFKWKDQNGKIHYGDGTAARIVKQDKQRLTVNPNVVTMGRTGQSVSVARAASTPVTTPYLLKTATRSKASPAQCKAAKKGLKKLRARMRKGYKSSEQKRLHEKELAYMKQRRDHCK